MSTPSRPRRSFRAAWQALDAHDVEALRHALSRPATQKRFGTMVGRKGSRLAFERAIGRRKRGAPRPDNRRRALVLARALGLLDDARRLTLAPAPTDLGALAGCTSLRSLLLRGHCPDLAPLANTGVRVLYLLDKAVDDALAHPEWLVALGGLRHLVLSADRIALERVARLALPKVVIHLRSPTLDPDNVRRVLRCRRIVAADGRVPRAHPASPYRVSSDARWLLVQRVPSLRSLARVGEAPTLRALRLVQCRRLASLEGLRAPGLREAHIAGCPALTRIDFPRNGAPLRRLSISAPPPDLDGATIPDTEALTLRGLAEPPVLAGHAGLRRLHLDGGARESVPVERLPPGLTHLGLSRWPALLSLAALGEGPRLRALTIAGCPKLPAEAAGRWINEEIPLLAKGTIPERPPPPKGTRPLSDVQARAARFFRSRSVADLDAAYQTALSSAASEAETLELAESRQIVAEAEVAFRWFRDRLRVALHGLGRDEQMDVVGYTFERAFRRARARPGVPLAVATRSLAFVYHGGFEKLARQRLRDLRNSSGHRWSGAPLDRSGKADPSARAGDALDEDLAALQTPPLESAIVSSAGPLAPEGSEAHEAPASERPDKKDGSPDRPWAVVRRAPLWQGDLGRWSITDAGRGAFRALAPLWLTPRTAEDGPVRQGQIGHRTLAALQTPLATTREDAFDTYRSLGVPAADLDDERLASAAWRRLGDADAAGRAAGERALQTARARLASVLDGAGADVDAWRAAVSAERKLAETMRPPPEWVEEAEAAWLALYGGTDRRGDSVKAAKEMRMSRGLRRLEATLLGQPVKSGEPGADLRWDREELRSLLAWCGAWSAAAGFGRGLSLRSVGALIVALEEALRRAGADDAARAVLVRHGGMAARIAAKAARPDVSEAVRTLARTVQRARATIDGWGPPRETLQLAVQASQGSASGDPETALLAAVLGADELLAAAAWLGVPPPMPVLRAVGILVAQADNRARARSARALALTHARFPPLDRRPRVLARMLARPVGASLPPPLAAALALPLLSQPASAAFADSGPRADALAPLAMHGPGRRAWFGDGVLQLFGPGWRVPGLALTAEAVGRPGERRWARLGVGVWRVLHERREVAVLVIRPPG